MTTSLAKILLAQLDDLLWPLVQLVEADDPLVSLRRFLQSAGWKMVSEVDPASTMTAIEAMSGAVLAARDGMDAEDLGAFVERLDELLVLYTQVEHLIELIGDAGPDPVSQDDLAAFSSDVLHRLLVDWIGRKRVLGELAPLLGIVVREDVDERSLGGWLTRRKGSVYRLRPEALQELLADPVGSVRGIVIQNDWATPTDAAASNLFLSDYMTRLLAHIGGSWRVHPDALAGSAQVVEHGRRGLVEITVPVSDAEGRASFGFEYELLSAADAGPGMEFAPFGGYTHQFGSRGWTVQLDVGVTLGGVDPGESAPTIRIDRTGVDVDPSLDAGFEVLGVSDLDALVGGRGTRLQLGTLEAGAGLNVTDGDGEAAFSLVARGSRIVLSAADLGEVVADVAEFESTVELDLGLAWSSVDGLTLAGAGSLEAEFSERIEIGGVVTLSGLRVALEIGEAITASAVTDASLKLGPLALSFRDAGLALKLALGGDATRPFSIAPHPPLGVGVAVDAGPITGAGYLEFFPDEHRYSGTFELQLGDLGVTVVGLLKTELAGTDGYSLLLLITAELPPIQLGFGFVLTGIGGLGGVHRGTEKKALGKAVRSGNLDSVLFPEDVVANANQIITDLRSIFPPRPELHVFGPMLEVGWGTPTVLEMQIGVLVSIPTWQIVLLGKIAMALPDEEAALIELNLAVLGVLDLPAEELSIDATLYDSRVLAWSLSGDMAMRLGFGADPRFLLSVGGFHPRYVPPAGFPELRRVKASLSPPGGNPRLEFSGYLAVTSNTFQVGAGVVLEARAGPARVYGQLSFDALFRFSPFEFVVDFYATLKIEIKGHGLSIDVDGTLSGPEPFRVKATIKVKVLLLDVTVRVNATIGPSGGRKELPTATVLPRLVEELSQERNWMAQQPEGGEGQLVSLRDPNADAGKRGEAPPVEVFLAHPLGTLGVRQQIVPLGVRIEKFGNARPAHTKFELVEIKIEGATDDGDLAGQETLREKFAPADFRKMTDDEKLEAPAFERLPAGRTVRNGLIRVVGTGEGEKGLSKEATLAFEVSVIDEASELASASNGDAGDDDEPSWAHHQPALIGDALARTSRVARAGTRTRGAARYRNENNPLRLSVSDDRFVIVEKVSLQRLDIPANPAGGRTRIEAVDTLNEHVASNPDHQGRLHVVHTAEVTG